MPYMMPRYRPNNVLAQKIFEAVLQSLSGPERNVLEYRMAFGLDKALTLEKTGELIGVSKERIRQLEDQALMRIALLSHPKMQATLAGQDIRTMKYEALKKEYEKRYGTREETSDDDESE